MAAKMVDVSPVLQAHGVTKVFETKLVRTAAVLDVDLTIRRGDFLCVRGPSGSGKSTLLSLLALLLPPTSGELFFFGQSISSLDAADRARVRNQHVGVVFQAYNLIEELSVINNVLLPTTFSRTKVDKPRERATELLERVRLSHRIDHYPAELSGGQQQRVAIARSLIMGPSVILADEPTGNLDSESSKQILDLLLEINSGGTALVVVTHNDDVARLAPRKYHMHDGKLAPRESEPRSAAG